MEPRRTKHVVWAAGAILLVLLAASAAYSYAGRGWGYRCQLDPAARQDLKLTADQQAKIKALREAHYRDVQPLREKMFQARGELRQLARQDGAPPEKVYAARKEVRSLRDRLDDKRFAFQQELRTVLTPEQQRAWQQGDRGWSCRAYRFDNGRGGHMRGGPGMGAGRGPGWGMPGAGRGAEINT